VTPVLNGAKFVAGCVDNVASQRCDACEHLIVDGGSTDGTVELLREYARERPHVRVFVRPGLRQSAALNLGIAESRGDIIGILNVDDFYSPQVLRRIVELYGPLPNPTLLVGNCVLWSGGQQVRINRPDDLRLEALLLGPDHKPFPFNPAAYFYHKSIHEIVGEYDEHDDYTMDFDFLLMAIRSAHVEYRDEIWGNFRLHEAGKTQIEKAEGRHEQRQRAVLEKYRRRLPLAKRIVLRLKLLLLDARQWARRVTPSLR
jgi:glycosyltransferase involved in cell wall biosynthesis